MCKPSGDTESHSDPRVAFFDHHAATWDQEMDNHGEMLHRLAALRERLGLRRGVNVLEIGCGDGRLTWLYADQAAHVVALDPKADDIALAVQNCPPHLRERVEFRTGAIQDFASSGTFDLALLSWSL